MLSRILSLHPALQKDFIQPHKFAPYRTRYLVNDTFFILLLLNRQTINASFCHSFPSATQDEGLRFENTLLPQL